MAPTDTERKLHRWTDLIAVLLKHGRPGLRFDQLREHVGDYINEPVQEIEANAPAVRRKEETIKRTFERDKDELKALGIHIEAGPGPVAPSQRDHYYLATRTFYLPYLHLVGTETRNAVRVGHRDSSAVAVTDNELELIVRAGHRIQSLGDEALAHECRMALLKFGHDLPMADALVPAERVVLTQQPDAAVLRRTNEALRRRKRLHFTYHSIHRGETRARTAEPYGLAFLSGHWFLFARDVDANALRQFRVSRMSKATMHTRQEHTPDYDIPGDFSLKAYAAPRQPWELTGALAVEAEVEFLTRNAFTNSAMQLGRVVDAKPMRRRYTVQRSDEFARWVIGLAGEARVVAPTSLVTLVRTHAAVMLGRQGA